MYKTATRAKSRDSCVRVKESVAAAEGEAAVELGVVPGPAGLVVEGVVVGKAEVSNVMVGFGDVIVSKEIEVKE